MKKLIISLAGIATVAAALLFTTTVASAGDTNMSATPNAYPSNSMMSPSQNGTVATSSAQQTANTVTIQNFAFMPDNVTVPMGTTVTWTNSDTTAHTVTGDTTGGPQSGSLQPGATYSFTFNQNGVYPYHCSIHPMMTGAVVVTQASMPQSSASSTNTSQNVYAANNTTTTVTPTPNPAATQAASTLPNTGSGNLLGLGVTTIVLGTIAHTIYTRRKLSRAES